MSTRQIQNPLFKIIIIIFSIIFTTTFISEVEADTITFSYTGAAQTWVVPPGVSSIDVDVRGAQGGKGSDFSIVSDCNPSGDFISGGSGGLGARVTATLSVIPGEVLYIYVGGVGKSSSEGGTGGYNGGGNGGSGCYDCVLGGGGGGASDIRRGGSSLANRVVVGGSGGGGGAAGEYLSGGSGGSGGFEGNMGEDGGIAGPYVYGGKGGGGGTQSAGGVGGVGGYGSGGPGYSSGGSGSTGTVGAGGVGGNSDTGYCWVGNGGGGGSGYYGGGGGGGGSEGTGGGGGGGGSSLVPAGGSATPSFQSGNGLVIIPYTSIPYIDCGLRIKENTGIIVIACEPLGALTSPFRIAKNGNIYGIVLVDPSDLNASKIRIQTSSGLKALRKF